MSSKKTNKSIREKAYNRAFKKWGVVDLKENFFATFFKVRERPKEYDY
jgi:hypothetical protein